MSPYSGLVDLCEGKGLLQKDGNSLKVTLKDGTTIKQFRKAWERNEDGCLDKLMDEVMYRDTLSTDTSSVTIDEETGEITTEE
jgi:hypothetical protein